MRERGELDTEVYSWMKMIETEYGTIKRPDVIPKPYPAIVEEMKHPEPVLNKDNPLYRTSNNSYGSKIPTV